MFISNFDNFLRKKSLSEINLESLNKPESPIRKIHTAPGDLALMENNLSDKKKIVSKKKYINILSSSINDILNENYVIKEYQYLNDFIMTFIIQKITLENIKTFMISLIIREMISFMYHEISLTFMNILKLYSGN